METKTVLLGAAGVLGVGALGYWGYRRWHANTPAPLPSGTPASTPANSIGAGATPVPGAPRMGCVVTLLSSTAAYPYRDTIAASIVPAAAVVVEQGTSLLVNVSDNTGRAPLLVATNRTTNQTFVLSWDPALYRVDCSGAVVT